MNARRLKAASVMGLLFVGAAGATTACADDDRSKRASLDEPGWSCATVDVPMGEVVRCTSTGTPPSETVAVNTGGVAVRTVGAPTGTNPREADCGPDAEPEAPPQETTPEEAPPPPPPPPERYTCVAGSGPNCPSTPPPAPPPAPGNEQPGPDECSQVSGLAYCGSPPPPPAPPPDQWSCSKDKTTGDRSCDSPPTCASGTHASSCGACVPDGEPDDCASPAEGGCWVTGGGFIVAPSVIPDAPADGNDNFGGNAKQMKNGSVQGHWNHVDHGTNSHAKGRPEYLYCRQTVGTGPKQPGGKKGLKANQVYFGGPAEWGQNGAVSGGYWFDVVAEDHGEPHGKKGNDPDTYHLTIRQQSNGKIVYEVKGELVGGNIQLHPSNNGHPGFQSQPPSWVSLEN
jgi:hypothetical protein